jgi:hypothetical protein
MKNTAGARKFRPSDGVRRLHVGVDLKTAEDGQTCKLLQDQRAQRRRHARFPDTAAVISIT